jgi:hypothetical protein
MRFGRTKVTDDVIQGLMDDTARALVGKVDALVLSALSKRFGVVDIVSLRGRLRCVKTMLDGVEVLYLDEVPLFELHPMEITFEGNKLTATRKYRELL